MLVRKESSPRGTMGMRKTILSLIVIAGTGIATLAMILSGTEDAPAQVRIVKVERGDVRQVVPISGRLAYADEQLAYAAATGTVSRVCVEPGQRVGKGGELIRIDASSSEKAISAFVAAGAEQLEPEIMERSELSIADINRSVIRAERECTVRQLLVEEATLITAGMPVVRLSSCQQEIVCTVSQAELARIEPGMWAWASGADDEQIFASVVSVTEPAADPLTGLLTGTVVLHPEQHIELPEGAAVDVKIYIAGSDDVLSLPVDAVTESGTVWWVQQGRCTEIPAGIVLSDEMRAWVTLPEGLLVAVGECCEGQWVTEVEE